MNYQGVVVFGQNDILFDEICFHPVSEGLSWQRVLGQIRAGAAMRDVNG
jgi:hypothetical protein